MRWGDRLFGCVWVGFIYVVRTTDERSWELISRQALLQVVPPRTTRPSQHERIELVSLLTSFLTNRKQSVVLNGQFSQWKTVKTGVPQGSILGPLLFLIYINDLSNNFKSQVKPFADDVSLFSVVHEPTLSSNDLNHDLKKIEEWSFHWKMSFNPDRSKKATEILFSKKRNIIIRATPLPWHPRESTLFIPF